MVFEHLGHLEIVLDKFYLQLNIKFLVPKPGLYDIALKNWGYFYVVPKHHNKA